MRLIKQSCEILNYTDPKLIEQAGRVCYKSEDKITEDSYKPFIKMLINKGHESVLEHGILTVKFITSRDITHELVRHRIASYSQESTRYVNYLNKGVQFVIPYWATTLLEITDSELVWDDIEGAAQNAFFKRCSYEEWELLKALRACEQAYETFIKLGLKPEDARSILPNCLKTEIIVTANYREWRHILKLRMDRRAHPQMQLLMLELYNQLRIKLPEIFQCLFRGLLHEEEE